MEACERVHPAHPVVPRARATAGGRPESNDDFLGEDIAHPNLRAQYRGFRMVLGLFLAAGVVALVLGSIDGAKDVAAAFPSFSSVGEGAAWSRFFSGLGTLATVGAIIVLAALFWRWKMNRARRRRRA